MATDPTVGNRLSNVVVVVSFTVTTPSFPVTAHVNTSAGCTPAMVKSRVCIANNIPTGVLPSVTQCDGHGQIDATLLQVNESLYAGLGVIVV